MLLFTGNKDDPHKRTTTMELVYSSSPQPSRVVEEEVDGRELGENKECKIIIKQFTPVRWLWWMNEWMTL